MTLAQSTSSSLANVPNVVWSGMIASTITLVGVLLADWRNTVRQKRQHDFDAEQNKLDRTMELRQELYVPIADALIEASAAFFSMPKLKFEGRELIDSDEQSAGMMKLQAAIAKLFIIAEASTVVLADMVSERYSEAQSELIDLAGPFKTAQMNLKANELSIVELESQFERVTKVLELRVEAGTNNGTGWTNMVREQEKFLKALEAAQEGNIKLVTEEGLEKTKYLRHVQEKLSSIEPLTLRLFAAMRAELTGGKDSELLTAELEHKRIRVRGETAKMFEDAEAKLKAK